MQSLVVLACLAGLAVQVKAAAECAASSFANLTLPGGKVTAVEAAPHTNFSVIANDIIVTNHYLFNVTDLDFCAVEIQYTHPGQNDTINVWVWLPTPDKWTGRMFGAGGGGWVGSLGNLSLPFPTSEGFATVSTDAGHTTDMSTSADEWALVSPGNLNYALLTDFASIALDDAATLGKAVIQAYYGEPPKHSYFNGCSGGGRQAHMLAQRYPTQYNGVLAAAAAFNWATFIPSTYWPPLVMHQLGKYPRQCELQAITQAVVAVCDELDGVVDNVVQFPGLCHFDPYSVVGQTINCTETGEEITVSKAAADVAAATWEGATEVDGDFIWYGITPDVSLGAQALTNCTNEDGTDTGDCRAVPFLLGDDWLRLFIQKNQSYDPTKASYEDYDRFMRQSKNLYDSVISAYDTDLTDFRDAGGKLLTWHGLADPIITSNATTHYTQELLNRDPNATDYFRYFEAPGVMHCGRGEGWFPGDGMNTLIDWVENGVAPETLNAKTVVTPASKIQVVREVNLCLYPKKLVYLGGDINVASSFGCA